MWGGGGGGVGCVGRGEQGGGDEVGLGGKGVVLSEWTT